MRKPIPRIDARYAAWGGALVLLLGAPIVAGFAGIGWELAQWAGYAAALACLALVGAPLRPRKAEPPTLVTLRLHTWIGWAALILTAAHIGGLLLADRTVVEYLKPTSPLYQLAGIGASLLLLFLVVLGLAGPRRRLWKSHRGFQATHVAAACLLTALVALHVVVTERYIGGLGRRWLFLAASIGALFMLLRARRPAANAHPPAAARHPLVFGRHSAMVLAVVVLCAGGLAALLPRPVDATLRAPLLRRVAQLPLDFPHGKHGAVNCLTCHHNYADGTGMDTCIACHRSARADLKEGAEARFHGFCLGCHRHPDATFKRHGPVAGCTVCHRAPPPDAHQGPGGPGS